MLSPERNPNSIGWEQLIWEETPYPGVSVSRIAEQPNPDNKGLPLYTLMAVQVDPEGSIPLHRHNREEGWLEIITFPTGGKFIIQTTDRLEVSGDNPISLQLGPGDPFGLKNNNHIPLRFYSRMQPGFTGYAEIEELS